MPARLECPKKVQTTKMLTHRVFQLKLVGRHVVQRRKDTFGIIHILEGVWVGCPGVDMLTHVPISSRCSTYTWLQYCLPRSGWWISGKGLAASPKPSPELAAVVAHRCVEKGSSRCMCFGARYLLGALSFLLFISL